MKIWYVEFQENGDEYTGLMQIKANKVKKMPNDNRGVIADGIEIIMDEDIISIEVGEEL